MRRPVLICVPLCALAISACATTASTSKFHGSEHSAAQTIANLQADVTSGEQKKICANDLAAPVVAKLGGSKACEAAVKTQLAEIDSTEVTVESVQISGNTATAKVRSVERGKKHENTVALVKEGSKWKISSLP
jgi:Domain of unknown function (DUF4878)